MEPQSAHKYNHNPCILHIYKLIKFKTDNITLCQILTKYFLIFTIFIVFSIVSKPDQAATVFLERCTKRPVKTIDLYIVDKGILYFPVSNNPLRNGQ